MRSNRSLFLGVSLGFLVACGADDPSQAAVGSVVTPPVGDAGTTPGTPVGGNGGAGTTPGAGQVGVEQPGDLGGMQPAPSEPEGKECEAHVVQGSRAIPDMLIVLDRSGSMNPDNNDDGTDRWGGSRTALIEVTDQFDDKVRFGLMTFPGVVAGGGDDQCAPGKLDVPIALDQGPTVASTLQSMNANGRTPTAAALQAALPLVTPMATPDSVAPPKYVLLVTDGDPNCSGAGGRGVDQLARTQTVAAIQALTQVGVKTFVVGYQTAGTEFAAQLDSMAAAGGTGAMQHRSVASGADLNATFSEIAASVISCSYQLDAAVNDAKKVLVQVMAKPRNLNQADDGWQLEADKRTVTLTGAACDEVRAGAPFSVQVTCEPVPLF